MKKTLISLLAGAICTVSFTASAIPAKKGLTTVPNADGTTLNVYLKGDEFSKIYTTEDGYPLLSHEGTLYYAVADGESYAASGIKAHDISERGASERLFISGIDKNSLTARMAEEPVSRQNVMGLPPTAGTGWGLFDNSMPRTGKLKGLVFLVEYQDVKFQMGADKAKAYFEDMLNGKDFTQYGGTGSAGQYFDYQSKGQFQPQFDIYGPVTLPQNQAYYGGNSSYNGGSDKNPHLMVTHAAELLDADVDFSQYDANKDGWVDFVFVFYAGRGEATGGGANTVWPHAWYVYKGGRVTCVKDGVQFDRYACSNEWNQAGRPDGVGTFIHEFSHVLGLPDEYNTGGSSASYTPGSWSVMDYGPYNNDGRTPPSYSAYQRTAVGWMKPEEMKDNSVGTLKDIQDSNHAYVVSTNQQDEVFLFENRQRTNWDKYLPGNGMLIWHIDFVQNTWVNNSPNNSSSHQYIDIVEANNNPNSGSAIAMAGYPWPGTARKTSFGPLTSPAFKDWKGTLINMPLTEITEKEGVISFLVNGGPIDLTTPSGFSTDTLTAGTAMVKWGKVENARGYLVDIEVKDKDGKYETFRNYKGYENGTDTCLFLDRLNFATTYRVSVKATAGANLSEAGVYEFSTLARDFKYVIPELNGGNSMSAKGMTLNWERIDDAASYLLTVKEEVTAENASDGCSFDGSQLPEGWTVSPAPTYESSYYGKSAPALAISSNKTITSPVYDTDILSLSYWSTVLFTGTSNMKIEANVNGEWVTVQDITISRDASGSVKSVGSMPEGARQIRITISATTIRMWIDDITLELVATKMEVYKDYNRKNVGSANSHEIVFDTPARAKSRVSAEEAERTFSYTLTAVNADGVESLESDPMTVYFSSQSGIGDTVVDKGEKAVKVEGRNIIAPEGSKVYDTFGRELPAENLPGGIYVVKTPAASVKVIVK